MTKIYLAGKIAKNDWRLGVVPEMYDIEFSKLPWPTLRTFIPGMNYVGPYFAAPCDHGCMHGPNTHGQGEDACQNWLVLHREEVHSRCLKAIAECDVFFAWLGIDDANTAFGTLVEIGYAKALNKIIIIGTDSLDYVSDKRGDGFDPHACTGGHGCMCGAADLWFAYKTAYLVLHAQSPKEALHSAKDIFDQLNRGEQRKQLESPLEIAFFDAWMEARLPELDGLTVQHKVTAGGKHYRLDFALPDRKIAFEMDGKTYHDTDKAFISDRRRDLRLELEGWRVHRFDGDLIRHDPAEVVKIAAQLVSGAA